LIVWSVFLLFSKQQHLGKAQGDDYTLDDMFVTASATKGSVRNEDKRTREKAVKG